MILENFVIKFLLFSQPIVKQKVNTNPEDEF